MKIRRVCLLLLALACICMALSGCAKASASTTATLTIQALNAWTAKGIAGVHIVIPEANVKVTTDESGMAANIAVPVSLPASSSGVLTPTWGEITILAYCEGYIDTIVTRVCLQPGENRVGPNLILFPQDDNPDPMIISEGPPQDWCQSILDTYRP